MGIRGFPGVSRQPRFVASFLEKLLFSEFVLDGDLWQQQAPVKSLLNQQAVRTYLYFVRANGLQVRKEGDFDFQAGKFCRFHGTKPRIVDCRTHRTLDDLLT